MMKRLVLLISLVCSTMMFSQENITNNDIIVTSDGQLIQAKVIRVTDNAINFNYPGESVINEIKVNKLQKIVFASGRTQNFNTQQSTAPLPKENTLSQRKNTPLPQQKPLIPKEDIYLLPEYKEKVVAIIPFSFVKNGMYEETLSGEATSYATNFLLKNASRYGIQIQDMNTTINKLIKAEISHKQLKTSTPEALRKITGTEFLVLAELKESSSKKNTNNATSFYSNSKTEHVATSDIRTTITLKLYDASSEKYNVSFTEVLKTKPSGKSGEQSLNKWKPSMEYVLEQFLLSKSL